MIQPQTDSLVIMIHDLCSPQDVRDIFAQAASNDSPIQFRKAQTLFRQGEVAGFVFFLCSGKVRLSVLAPNGKEAIVALLGRGQLAGEQCLTSNPRHLSTAVAIADSVALRVDRSRLAGKLVNDPRNSIALLKYVLSRNTHTESILIDQMFKTSEERLARLLLMMSHLEETTDRSEAQVSEISQGSLGEMIGTSRETVNLLMGKFKRLGYIESSSAALVVRKSITAILSQRSNPSGPVLDQLH